MEWNLLSATRNWKFFLRFVGLFVITKYIQAFAFEFMCLIVCRFVDLPAIAAQICIANFIIMIRLAYLGIADSVNYSIYKSLMDRNLQVAIKKFKIGLLITLFFSGLIIYQLLANKAYLISFLSTDPLVINEIQQVIPHILLVIFLEPIHALLSCSLSSMHKNKTITKIDLLSFYFVSISLSVYLCYSLEWGLAGIWVSWLTGLVLSAVIMTWVLLKTNYENLAAVMVAKSSQLRQTIIETVRESMV